MKVGGSIFKLAPIAAYIAIAAVAIVVDAGDNFSFGAAILSIFPVSMVATACLLLGPLLKPSTKNFMAASWLIGAAIVLIVALLFSQQGVEQQKVAEHLFAMAVTVIASPLTFLMPIFMNFIGQHAEGAASRIVLSWCMCVILFLLEWQILGFLAKKLRRGEVDLKQ